MHLHRTPHQLARLRARGAFTAHAPPAPPPFAVSRADALRAVQHLTATAAADAHNVQGGQLVPNDNVWAANANWSLALVNALTADDDAEFVEVEVDDEGEEEGEEEDGETIVYGDGLGGGMGGDDGMGGSGMGSSSVVA